MHSKNNVDNALLEAVSKGYLARNLYAEFSHYPTCEINESDILILTDMGKTIIENKEYMGLLLNPLMRQFLNAEIIFDLIKYFKRSKYIELVEYMKDNYSIHECTSKQHVMWMIKYGLIKIELFI